VKTSKEGTIQVGGKEFQFVKSTIVSYIEILSHDYETKFAALNFKEILVDDVAYKGFKMLWRDFCNSIFEKSFLWRVLKPFGYLPKPLRFKSILMAEIGGIIGSFFVWQGETQKPQEKPEETS
jgi:hypothetical protein